MGVRVSQRVFPDVAQNGIGAQTVITESRLTFTGQRGLVLCMWKLRVTNAAAVLVPQVSADFVSSFTLTGGGTGIGSFPAVAGQQLGIWAILLIRDPPENGFVEIAATTTGGTVDVLNNNSVVLALSFDSGVGEGPTVAVA